ncbi:MAG TPA: helix-turn-helix transcriptional regulator [Syntrophales bacterium]|nr:helix-turn-helix transcriptional regulator [Syntrophales bacterium]HPI57881.1 helix-turn-helix transcriptional regulator [Syntrophales bacterium]HPN24539.1 helix-turn-helix transcriptional regulator [Syntrophales bacterium]HQM28845.1 helix-turn-helix transcriptional regulator [Syntrophales bacterium]
MKDVNRKLKARIIETHGSQWEFAREVGIHEADVSRVLRGRKVLTAEQRRKWAKLLTCDEKEIFPDA